MDQHTPVSIGTELINARDLCHYTVLAIYPDGRLYVQRTFVTELSPHWLITQTVIGKSNLVEVTRDMVTTGSTIRHERWKGQFVVVAVPDDTGKMTVMQSQVVSDRSGWSLAYPPAYPGSLA